MFREYTICEKQIDLVTCRLGSNPMARTEFGAAIPPAAISGRNERDDLSGLDFNTKKSFSAFLVPVEHLSEVRPTLPFQTQEAEPPCGTRATSQTGQI